MTMYEGNGPTPSTALARSNTGGGMMQATEGADGSRSITAVSAQAHALAARQASEIQAQYVFARQNPRDLETVRLSLVKRCKGSRFASVARYRKPQGKRKNDETGVWEQQFVEGWSIRFVEEAIKTMGNLREQTSVVSDDEDKRIVCVSLVDLETMTSYSEEVPVPKRVERKELKRNQVPLGLRTNTYGETVYLLPATDDETRMAQARLVSMTLRTLGLRLIPGDILDECLDEVRETSRKDVTTDPNEARKKLVDAFDQIGVKPKDLVEYLGGRPLDALTPDLILELRAVYQAVTGEGVRWRDVLESSPYLDRDATGEVEPEKDSPAAKLRAKLDEKTRELGEKDRQAKATREAIGRIAHEVRLDPRQVQAVVALVKGGKSAADVARYGREQTGIEDEVLVGEVVARARKAGLLPPESSPGKGSEPPAAPVETAPERAAKQRKVSAAKRASIAEQEGVTPETVAAVEELASGGDDEVAISAALRVKGLPADPPTVAAILSALKK